MALPKPVKDGVLLKPLPVEEKSAGGIILLTGSVPKPRRCTVVEVGPGKPGEPIEVKVGDTVVIAVTGGENISWEGTEYIIISEEEILATL